jgi:DNA-binding NarL/FixJ family response regulator
MQLNETFPVLTTTKAAIFPPPQVENGTGTATHAIDDQPAFRRSRKAPNTAELDRLTRREFEVLVHLSKGLRYKEIADRLGISQGTLHFFIRNLYAKLHVHSRTEAAMKLVNR